MPLLSLAHLTVLDAHPLELVDAAAAGGFDAVGLRIVRPLPTDRIVDVIGDEPLIRSLRRRLAATGVRIFDVEAVWLMPETDVAALKPALDLGARLGAGHVLCVGNDPDPARLADRFGAFCALADGAGLSVALEPMSYVALRTPAQGLALLDAVRPKRAGLLVDALHFYRAGGDPADLAAMDPALFPYLHLCDAARAAPPAEGPGVDALRAEGRGGRFYPGEGALPLAAFMAALPQNIPVAVEAPCAAYAGLPVMDRARRCGEATRAFLDGVDRSFAGG